MQWRSKRVAPSNPTVPTAPGVYAIGRSDTLHDLEISRTYVHVGETKDLRRRPVFFSLPGWCSFSRQEYRASNYDDAIGWLAQVDAAETRAVQDDLIFRLRPRFNTAGNQPDNHEDRT
ncbi:MAG: hypothetical protein OXG35_14230 [Acidobacteria bacterium]|nr:hypothetical protein [Acidobacteriota bacterium]